MNIYTAFNEESKGYNPARLKIFLDYLSQRLAASDYMRALELLHAVVSPEAARDLDREDDEAAAVKSKRG